MNDGHQVLVLHTFLELACNQGLFEQCEYNYVGGTKAIVLGSLASWH